MKKANTFVISSSPKKKIWSVFFFLLPMEKLLFTDRCNILSSPMEQILPMDEIFVLIC